MKDYSGPDRYGDDGRQPIWDWFQLTYAAYLVLPRVMLQSMPIEWQDRFVGCLGELEVAFPDYESPAYAVFTRREDGRLSVESEDVRLYRHNYWTPKEPS